MTLYVTMFFQDSTPYFGWESEFNTKYDFGNQMEWERDFGSQSAVYTDMLYTNVHIDGNNFHWTNILNVLKFYIE